MKAGAACPIITTTVGSRGRRIWLTDIERAIMPTMRDAYMDLALSPDELKLASLSPNDNGNYAIDLWVAATEREVEESKSGSRPARRK